jgi:hypothetical protein
MFSSQAGTTPLISPRPESRHGRGVSVDAIIAAIRDGNGEGILGKLRDVSELYFGHQDKWLTSSERQRQQLRDSH